MAITMTNIVTEGIRYATVEPKHYDEFSVVSMTVSCKEGGYTTVTFHAPSPDDVAAIMAGMAKAVREYYADAEPEPDWEAIAAEMDELCRER